MKVSEIVGNGNSISIKLFTNAGEKQIYFKSKDVELCTNSESIITASILPNMKLGLSEPFYVHGQVDSNFLNSINKLQEIFRVWDNQFSKIKIHSCATYNESVGGEGVGVFFTGGVDSFYSFLKHREEVTHLIFVQGFDINIANLALRKDVSRMIRNIGAKYNKKVVEVETNLRKYFDQSLAWNMSHGAALATIGHILKLHLKKIYIPATYTYSNLYPLGSHPLTDPLWSSSQLVFEHDGANATRIEKLEYISSFDFVLNALRVCYKNPYGAYNCGQCEKCVRTMLNLKGMGLLHKTSVFETPLRVQNILKIKNYYYTSRTAFLEQNLSVLKKGKDKKFIWALKWVLLKSNIIRPIRNLLKRIYNDSKKFF